LQQCLCLTSKVGFLNWPFFTCAMIDNSMQSHVFLIHVNYWIYNQCKWCKMPRILKYITVLVVVLFAAKVFVQMITSLTTIVYFHLAKKSAIVPNYNHWAEQNCEHCKCCFVAPNQKKSDIITCIFFPNRQQYFIIFEVMQWTYWSEYALNSNA